MKKLSDYSVNLHSEKRSNKLFSLIVTSVIIGMLFFLGPVNAFNMQIEGLRTTPYYAGEQIVFDGKIDIEPNEIVNIQNFSLVVNDQEVCVFNIDGHKFTQCEGVEIDLTYFSAFFGYGYGYGYFSPAWSGSNRSSNAGHYNGTGSQGEFEGYQQWNPGEEMTYHITIDTPQDYLHYGGANTIKLITNTRNQVLNSREHVVVLNPYIIGDGDFLFGTDDNGAMFTGRYDSENHILAGVVNWTNANFVRIGVGNYTPYSENSGEFEIKFYDPANPMDPGLTWVGTYTNETWSMNYTGNMAINFNGPSYIVPR